MILFQIKVFVRNIKKTTLARYFINLTARSSFRQLTVIIQINRVYNILKKKICHKDSVVSLSCLNLLVFPNRIFLWIIWLQVLEIWSNFQKIWVCKKSNKQRGSLSPNTDNFLPFFIVFEWGRISENAMNK